MDPAFAQIIATAITDAAGTVGTHIIIGAFIVALLS